MILMLFLKTYHVFGEENGRGRRVGAKGSGTSKPDQKVAHWVDLLDQLLSQKTVVKNLPNLGPNS